MEEQKIELRSDDVQEILGTPPNWLVRFGTLMLLGLVGALILAAWMIRYPDVISAKVVLTTAVPPVEVVARTEGHILKLLARDNEAVQRGDVLVVLQSTAHYEDVLRLDAAVSAWLKAKSGIDTFRQVFAPRDLELGELQTDYSIFTQNLDNFKFGKSEKSASVQSSVSNVGEQIASLKKGIGLDQNAKSRAAIQLENAKEFFVKQQDLYGLGVISRVELERERLKLADVERQFDALDEAILRKKNEITSLQKSIGDFRFDEKQDASSATTNLSSSLNNLRSRLDAWRQTYLLTAPIDGNVSLNAGFFSQQQFVKQGDQVMTLVPSANDKIIGRVLLPIVGSGKVELGQRVILRLDSYPYYEFGTVEGRVESRSAVPKDNMYLIEISLPQGLRTSYGRELKFEQQLQGDAQIVTEDKRFLERIWEQIFAKATAYR